jgi:hypothetical protein
MRVVCPCEFRGVHSGAAVVVCPPGLSDAELRMIGRRCVGVMMAAAPPALAPPRP